VDHGVQVLDVLFRSAESVDVDVVRVLVLNYAQKSIPKDYVVDVLPGVVHCGRDHGIHIFVLVLHQLDQVFEQIQSFYVNSNAQHKNLVFRGLALVHDECHEILEPLEKLRF